MSEQTGERERLLPLERIVERETHVTRSQCITGLIGTLHIQRRLEPHHDPVLTQHELVRSHPLAIGAQDTMVRRTHQLAAILQHERDTGPCTPVEMRDLVRRRKSGIPIGTEQAVARGPGQALDRTREPVSHEHRGALGDARRASIAHDVEPERFQILHRAGGVQVLGHHLGARRHARLHE